MLQRHPNVSTLGVIIYDFGGRKNPASNATSGDIVTTLSASVTTVAVAHPTLRRRWLQIAGSTVCHLTLQHGLRQWTQSVLASSLDRRQGDPRQMAEIRKLRVNLQLLKSKWCLIWYVIGEKQLLRHYRIKYSLLIQKINFNASNFEAPPWMWTNNGFPAFSQWVASFSASVSVSLGFVLQTLSVTSHRCAPLNFVFCVTIAAF